MPGNLCLQVSNILSYKQGLPRIPMHACFVQAKLHSYTLQEDDHKSNRHNSICWVVSILYQLDLMIVFTGHFCKSRVYILAMTYVNLALLAHILWVQPT